MVNNLAKHPFFERWVDPASGIESFILRERVAPIQQSFYFTNPGVSPDGKWLWFYASFPPNRQGMLGVVSLDPDKPEAKLFPQAGFTGASPMITPESDGAYFCMANHVYRVGIDGSTRVMCTLPEEYIGKRNYSQIATHLTMSADRKYFLLDGDLGNFWWVGIGDIRTGEVTILKEFGNCHNHALFSPTDPKLFLIPEDWWCDKISGRYFKYDHRLWLMDIDQKRYEIVRPKDWDCGRTANASHEWWSADGMVCWNDYALGTYECDPYTLKTAHVWKRSLCHAHCSFDRRFWCADESPYRWKTKPVEILFFDRELNRDVQIVSAMPLPPVPRDMYHLVDPHPHFSPKDSWVVYTTTVRGQVDVALSSVEGIVKLLKARDE